MKLYDSLSNSIKKIDLTKPKINIYACGPTVYNYIHIGNARPNILMDTLIRFLKSQNVEVDYLQNITDIDDKIIQKSIDEKIDEVIVSQHYLDEYLKDLKAMNVLLPTKMIKISEKLEPMVNLIEKMIKNNSAYQIDGNVYFDIEKYKNEYGKLSKQKINEMITGEREIIKQSKKGDLDFALWKNTQIGKKWESPFGIGRPGWHTECATLIDDYFDHQTIDIHGGGIDLKFPHHENERIQFLALNQKEITNFWVHNGHVTIDNQKMSKSIGNVILVKDFLKEHGPNVLRWIFLTSRYQQPINISQDLIDQANKFFSKIENLRKKLIKEIILNNFKIEDVDLIATNYYDQFVAQMNDDLNTPIVLSIIEKMLKDLNQNFEPLIFNQLIKILTILGFDNLFEISISDEDKQEYLNWLNLVETKEYDQADIIRQNLITKGLL